MNILVYNFNSPYILRDITDTLTQMGHHSRTITDTLEQACYEDDSFSTRMQAELHDNHYDAVMTINYYPVAAKVCHQENIPYLAWQDDSPPNLPTNETLDYPTNRIFLFSQYDYLQYRNAGLDTVCYLPLAANWKKYAKILRRDTSLSSDVSLVGRLYPSTLPELRSIMSPEQQQYIEAVVQVQLKHQGCDVIDAAISEDFTQQIREHYLSQSSKAIQPSRAQLVYSISTWVTRLERLMLLQLSSRQFHTRLYAPPLNEDEKKILDGVDKHLPIDYATEMPLVFYNSKVNLNPVLRSNRTAIPLRALDIMACQGFLLTSHQPELDLYFKAGEEYVSYEDIPDALEKMKYYLAHDAERERIIRNAYLRIQQDFCYEDRLKTILAAIG